jgi:hypothetical protein
MLLTRRSQVAEAPHPFHQMIQTLYLSSQVHRITANLEDLERAQPIWSLAWEKLAPPIRSPRLQGLHTVRHFTCRMVPIAARPRNSQMETILFKPFMCYPGVFHLSTHHLMLYVPHYALLLTTFLTTLPACRCHDRRTQSKLCKTTVEHVQPWNCDRPQLYGLFCELPTIFTTGQCVFTCVFI